MFRDKLIGKKSKCSVLKQIIYFLVFPVHDNVTPVWIDNGMVPPRQAIGHLHVDQHHPAHNSYSDHGGNLSFCN